MENKNIPKQILEATKDLRKDEDFVCVENIGVFDNKDVYKAMMSKDCEIGFPLLYLFDGKNVERVYGFDALKLVISLQK